MPEYEKILPSISPETKRYWDACKRGQLLTQKCTDCGEYQFYRRAFCSHCWSYNVEDVVSSGKGTVWTYTVTNQNRAPGYRDEVPYVVALVELEGGIKMFTNIVECNPEDVKIGMPVEVVFQKATDDITIPYFKPA